MSKGKSEFGKGCVQQLVYFAKHFAGEPFEAIYEYKHLLDKYLKPGNLSAVKILSNLPKNNYNKVMVQRALNISKEEAEALARKKKLSKKKTAALYMKLLRKELKNILAKSIHLFFNAASDHLYELVIPPRASPNLKRKLKILRNLALRIGHGFSKDEGKSMTFQNFEKVVNMTFEVARMFDYKLGIRPIKAEWS